MPPGFARRVVVRVAIPAALIALATAPVAVSDPVTAPVATWAPDGEVKAVAVSGSTAYIGGNFTRIAPYTGSSALFNAANGEVKKPWPEVNGVVNAVVADGSGGWYLGGDFRSVGGAPRTDLAHVLADRNVDPAWAPATDGTVRALALAPGEVYAGGEFTTANGQTRGHLVAFSRTTGAVANFTGGVSNSGFDDFKGVHALLLSGSTLYAGGIFDQAQGSNGTPTRHRVAAFNTANSQVLAWDPDANHTVNGLALVPNSTDVFISGRFNALKDNTPSEVARHGIARVDGTNGVAASNWIAPLQFGPELSAMAVSGSTVYIGGGNINFGQGKLPAAALSVTGAVPSATWKPATPGAVTSLAAAGSTVYIGTGDFGSGPLSNGPHPGLIAVDATNASPTPFVAPAMGRGRQQFPSGGSVGTRAIGVNGSDVVAGGTFINVGGVERRNLAAIDLNTGQPTAFNPPLKGQFSALTSIDAVALTDDGLVWAGGNFLTEGPNERLNLAAFDANTGALASFHRDPNSSGVSALVARGSMVYVGGGFTNVGGMPRNNIAAVRNVPGQQGDVLPFDVDTDGPVTALALASDTLYLGGQFQNVNRGLAALTRERHNLAAVDVANGLARPWDPNAHGQVRALALAGDTVYAGGEFDTVNGSTPRQRLAAFDSQAGTARAWNPGADAPVRSLAVFGPTVFAGGDFANAGGVARSGVADFDAQTGAPDAFSPTLETEERDGPLPPVTRVGALFASPQTGLLTGGSFVMNSPAPRSANLGLFGLAPLPGPGAVTPGGEAPGGPGAGGGVGQVTPGDGLAPDMSALSASAKSFRVGPGATASDGTATVAAAKKKKKPPRGTTLTLRLSEPARVKFEVLVKGKGRKVGKRCVKQTKKNRKRRRCTRLTLKKPAFTRSAPAGRSKVKWSGRLGRKALKRGSYQLRATPTDAAGNTGKPRTLNFTIVR
jgi:trimeric autotransporter adhesin